MAYGDGCLEEVFSLLQICIEGFGSELAEAKQFLEKMILRFIPVYFYGHLKGSNDPIERLSYGIANLLHMIMYEEKVFPEDARCKDDFD